MQKNISIESHPVFNETQITQEYVVGSVIQTTATVEFIGAIVVTAPNPGSTLTPSLGAGWS